MNLSRFGYLRVAACSPAVRVADVEFNCRAIAEAYRALRSAGVQIAVFPEMATVGYTCADLVLHSPLLDASDRGLYALATLVGSLGGMLAVGAPIRAWGRLYNCAVVISSSGIVGVVPKQFIPNYGEYYEQRWFARPSGQLPSQIAIAGQQVPFGPWLVFEALVGEMHAATIGVELCEDLWAPAPPSEALACAGADVLLNLSASNEVLGKADYRRDLVRMQSARCIAGYVYASAGAGESTTDTVYSGHCIIAENGVILGENRSFSFNTEWVIADLDCERLQYDRRRIATFGQQAMPPLQRMQVAIPALEGERPHRVIDASPFVPANPSERAERCQEIAAIQETALAKRLLHTGLRAVVLGLSGGLDSALALLVSVGAFDRLGYDRKGIHAVILPGPGTSERTRQQAEALARALGASVQIISITDAVEYHLDALGHTGEHDVLFENAQARERTQILMDLCHKHHALMVGTSDLSELALGWTTYGGDHMSMYGVNAGVPKTLVRYIIEWWAQALGDAKAKDALAAILETPISPELLPPSPDGSIVQRTEEVLGPYQVHDFFLYNLIRWGYAPEKLLELAVWAFEGKYARKELDQWLSTFLERFFANQFKRSCLPDGPKVGSVALSPRADWRMPSDALPVVWLASGGEMMPPS